MSKCTRAACGGLVLLLSLVALPVFGAEGRTPIWQPTTLGSTGKYIVTRNIVSAAGPVITVAGSSTENIDIDLNGMTLTGGGGGHVVDVSNVATFVLRNGSIDAQEGAGDGVHVTNTGEVVIEDLTIQPGMVQGIFIGENVHSFAVRRNLIRLPSDDGIQVDAGFP